MFKPLRDILTGLDGVTHDIGRWLGAGCGLNLIVMSDYDCIVNHVHFDGIAFGGAVLGIATGLGALLKLKAETEPKSPDSKETP